MRLFSDFALSFETREASDFANRDGDDEPLGKASSDRSSDKPALSLVPGIVGVLGVPEVDSVMLLDKSKLSLSMLADVPR